MTTREAIADIRFWLDQNADWFNSRQIVVAINRSITEWVLDRYESGLATERNRRELGRLIPAPLTGSGIRIILDDSVWLVISVEVQHKDNEGNWLDPVACQPVGFDQKARARTSVFHRPTDSYPLYVQQRQTSGVGEFLEVLSKTPPDKYLAYYVQQPPRISETELDYVWEFIPPFAQEQIKQKALRMLEQAISPDYSSQVQIEEPKSMALGQN